MARVNNFIINSDFPSLAQKWHKSVTVISHASSLLNSEKWREDYIDINAPTGVIQRVNIKSHTLGFVTPGYVQVVHLDSIYTAYTKVINPNTLRLVVQCVQLDGKNNTIHTESFDFNISAFWLP